MSSQNPNEQDDNQEKNNEEENLDNDVVQNSQDDITEDEEDYETGKNMLLAYYDKNSRKRDRRKITFKHCILRINDTEYLIPQARGDFNWNASNKRAQNYYT